MTTIDKQRKAVQAALARGEDIINGGVDDEDCPLCDAFRVGIWCGSCPIAGNCMEWIDLTGAEQKAEQWRMMARAEKWLKDNPAPPEFDTEMTFKGFYKKNEIKLVNVVDPKNNQVDVYLDGEKQGHLHFASNCICWYGETNAKIMSVG